MKRNYHTIASSGKANERQLTDFLSRNGQFLLPMMELIEQSRMASEELTSFLLWMNRLCSRLPANRDEFISELFSLPFEFGFQVFLAVDVPCCPDGLVVFDLTLHDCVKHNRNLVGSSGGSRGWPDFALHAAEIISHRC